MTGGSPVVSVVIPCGRDAETLPLQLAALARQLSAPAFEVLVVNNGAPGALDHLVDDHPDLPFTLRVVEATERQGSSYARNVGAARARSGLLMFCDADDVVSAHWVRCGIQAFELAPVWTGAATAFDDHVFQDGHAPVQQLVDRDLEDSEPVPDTPSEPTVLMGCNFGIRRDLYRAVGGFDVTVPHHGDDNDLAARLRAHGAPIPRVESVRVAYRQRRSFVQRCLQAHADCRAAQLLETRIDGPLPRRDAVLRVAVLALRAPLFPVGMALRRQWEPAAIATRWCHVLGTVDGLVRYAVLRRVPPRELGAGWDAPQG